MNRCKDRPILRHHGCLTPRRNWPSRRSKFAKCSLKKVSHIDHRCTENWQPTNIAVIHQMTWTTPVSTKEGATWQFITRAIITEVKYGDWEVTAQWELPSNDKTHTCVRQIHKSEDGVWAQQVYDGDHHKVFKEQNKGLCVPMIIEPVEESAESYNESIGELN